MILELDLGNTYCKWRMLDADNNVTGRGIGVREEWLLGMFPESWRSVDRVRVASVLGDAVERELDDQLRRRLQSVVEWARSTADCSGVRNAYFEPGRLGVDRWLALIAAYQRSRGAVLVCDIGSALTIDLVDSGGTHRGGYIIPGPRLMADVLLKSTDRVRFDDTEISAAIDPGQNTGACVGNGIATALGGAVVLAHRRAQELLNEPVATHVTGGYRDVLAQNLAAAGFGHLELNAELVLDGLRWALP